GINGVRQSWSRISSHDRKEKANCQAKIKPTRITGAALRFRHRNKKISFQLDQMVCPAILTVSPLTLVSAALSFGLKIIVCAPRRQVQRLSSWPSTPFSPARRGINASRQHFALATPGALGQTRP